MVADSEIIQLIGNLGFPIVVSLYFMFYTKKTIDANTEATTKLITLIESKFGVNS